VKEIDSGPFQGVPRPRWRKAVLSEETNPVRVPGERIEQRTRLRIEQPLVAATLIIRGGVDTVEKLRQHAERTERAWALDGVPLLGVSVFAVLDMSLDDLLCRSSTCRCSQRRAA